MEIGKLSAGEVEAAFILTAGASLRDTAAGVLVERGGGMGVVVLGGGAGRGTWTGARAAVAMAYLLSNHGQRQSTAQRADSAQLAILTMHRRFQVHRLHYALLFKRQN